MPTNINYTITRMTPKINTNINLLHKFCHSKFKQMTSDITLAKQIFGPHFIVERYSY